MELNEAMPGAGKFAQWLNVGEEFFVRAQEEGLLIRGLVGNGGVTRSGVQGAE